MHEVAKDLNVPSKDVIELLGKHFDTPKKHMTALTEEELNVVFEHFTQKAQVENFDRYFASANKEAPKAKEPVKKQEAPAEKKAAPAQEKKPQNEKPQKTCSRTAETGTARRTFRAQQHRYPRQPRGYAFFPGQPG